MRSFIRSRRALGTPVSNLIILMAAVILSTTVVIFAVNLTSSQLQKESLFIASSHVWYANSTFSEGAVILTNIGSTDSVLSKIDVDGLLCQWNSTDNYVVYAINNGTFPGDLVFVGDIAPAGSSTIAIGGQPFTFSTATGGLTLKAGESIAFYIAIPSRIMVYNLATSVRTVITTTQAIYCTDTLVEAT
ncbi:MAG TPA: hypothetical protein VMD05_08785 [Candidatus Nanoarchaeia archaeon]|nr:hypothetical protein [Candidatus Nanoarchaeia archaeon]